MGTVECITGYGAATSELFNASEPTAFNPKEIQRQLHAENCS